MGLLFKSEKGYLIEAFLLKSTADGQI